MNPLRALLSIQSVLAILACMSQQAAAASIALDELERLLDAPVDEAQLTVSSDAGRPGTQSFPSTSIEGSWSDILHRLNNESPRSSVAQRDPTVPATIWRQHQQTSDDSPTLPRVEHDREATRKEVASEERSLSPESFVNAQHAHSSTAAIDPTLPSFTVPIDIPYDILTKGEREQILLYLHAALQNRPGGPVRGTVWPLILEDMSPTEYKSLYRSLFAARNNRGELVRFLWIRDGFLYLFGRPDKSSPGFSRMHGTDGGRLRNLYSVWRLEYHGHTRIWRYLGGLHVPGHRPPETFMRNGLLKLADIPQRPKTFLRDAAHVDPGQPMIT